MKKIYILICLTLCINNINAQEVTEIWTNYGGFWNSSSVNNNPVLPDSSHDLLAFRYDGVIYSTGVDDATLTNNGVSYTSLEVRALPVATLPINGSNLYVGLGQLIDGIDDGTDDGPVIPFAPITDGSQLATFLTDGPQGLDLGTNVANIPSGTTARFNLSSAGININNVGDGTPDILVSQTAQPSSNNQDELEFIDSDGNTVGNVLTLVINTEPRVGEWNPDFYSINSTGNTGSLLNGTRPIHFFAADIADFGITAANVNDAVALLYRPNGTSDPSFIAFNEPSLGVATQLSVILQPNLQNCDGTLPGSIQVLLEDQNDNAVAQAGIAVTASLASGPGDLIGTLTRFTDGTGVATFNDLEFTVGGSHVIRFDYAGLDAGLTSVIENGIDCDIVQWTGNTDTNWSDVTNWSPQVVPDANNDVIIPNGRPNYPVLDIDAGAGDLTMGSTATIDLNGFLFALNGSLANVDTGASIDASTAGSDLYMSANTAQNIPAGFLEPDVANFTVENVGGVTLNSEMNILQILTVKEGLLNSNDNITMICTFVPVRQTAQIGRLEGSISGDITVEQCYPGRRAFRLVSPSTTGNTIHNEWQENPIFAQGGYQHNPRPDYGTHITGLGYLEIHSNTDASTTDQTDGLDWQPSGNPSMFSFNENTQGWDSVLDTENTTLNAGNPYLLMIRGNRSVDLELNSSPTSDTRLQSTGTILKGPVSVNPSINNGEFALIGNPFHASVDLNKVIPGNGFTNFVYVFDPNLGGNSNTNASGQLGGRGGYVTVNVTNGTTSIASGITGITATEANQFLQPYQAFFIQASPTGTPGSLVFEEVDKSVDQPQIDVFESSENPRIFINLFDKESLENLSSPEDGLVIYFSEIYKNSIDVNDAPKFFNQDEVIARSQDNSLVSFENRAMPSQDDVLELYTNQYRTTNYVLEIGIQFLPDHNAFLHDKYLDVEVALDNNLSNIYNFSVDSSIAESVATDRFELRFQTSTLGTDDFDAEGISVYPNPASTILNVDFGLNIGRFNSLELFDISGRLVRKQSISNQLEQTQLDVSAISSGVYLLKVSSNKEQFSTKLIIK